MTNDVPNPPVLHALAAMMESIEPLQAALDGALITLHASAAAAD